MQVCCCSCACACYAQQLEFDLAGPAGLQQTAVPARIVFGALHKPLSGTVQSLLITQASPPPHAHSHEAV